MPLLKESGYAVNRIGAGDNRSLTRGTSSSENAHGCVRNWTGLTSTFELGVREPLTSYRRLVTN
jgi:hypothetical protein